MEGQVHGDEGGEHHHRGEGHEVQEVPHHQRLQLLPAGDLARVVLLKHCGQETGGQQNILKITNTSTCAGHAEQSGHEVEEGEMLARCFVIQLWKDVVTSKEHCKRTFCKEGYFSAEYLKNML